MSQQVAKVVALAATEYAYTSGGIYVHVAGATPRARRTRKFAAAEVGGVVVVRLCPQRQVACQRKVAIRSMPRDL